MRTSVVIGSALCHAMLILALMHWARPGAEEVLPKSIDIVMVAPPPPPPPAPPPKPVPKVAEAKPTKAPVPTPPRPAIQPRVAAPQPTPQEAAPFVAAQAAQPAENPSTAAPVATAAPKPSTAAPTGPETAVSAKPIGGKPLVYPPRMRDQEHEGGVDFDCAIETDGTTSDCQLVAVQGDDEFAAAARTYVQAARYKPATRGGVPVRQAHHKIHVEFRLD